MNDLDIMKTEYTRNLKSKGAEDGYLKVDGMFIEIGESPNHELSLKSALEFVDFYGYEELTNWDNGKRGFVARSAFERIGKSLECGCLLIGSNNPKTGGIL